MLNLDQIAQFENDGYYILRGHFESAAVDELRAAMAEVLAELKPGDAYVGFDPWPDAVGDSYNPRRVIYVNDLHERHPRFDAHLRDPRILGALATLLGPDIDAFQCATIIKPPHINFQYHGWHQDAYDYGKLANRKHIATISYLNAVAPDAGSTSVVPGTHSGELLPQKQVQVDGWPQPKRVLEGFERYAARVATPHFEPGDALLFSSWLMHRANSNRDDENKVGLINVYHAAGCLTPESAAAGKVTGLPMLRGGEPAVIR